MRKITQDSVYAFFCGRPFSSGNMTIHREADGSQTSMELHCNCIARRYPLAGKTWLSDCGWQTVTTKERLNGILAYLKQPLIYQRDFVWYQGDDVWPGTITITD